ncbi:MAG: Fe(3+) dicitrate transport protein FecA [Stenotrophomonas maltophilia]|uniref:Fe(3+) dicitrate transport protein FecA n=1 Tax=Stenotrophomonas maltophilia TaxID=40324 RepID=A0A7V8JM64_STEMA|nr:MAG: Fe(3+) dicitrate transport protein FecA [Stenotrophomonas maltophilia]
MFSIAHGRRLGRLHALPLSLAVALAWPVLPAMAAPAQAFDLPAQPLDASLMRIASQAGVALSVDSRLLHGLQAAPVHGQMDAEAALRTALSPHALVLVRTPSGAYSVVAAPPVAAPPASSSTAAAPRQAMQLDTVRVEATSLFGQSRQQDAQTFAGARSVIDSQALASGAFRSLDDALQRVPGVRILDETGTGVLPQIMLRGLYESRSGRVQVLHDGIPLALAPYGQTSLSLFPVSMNQIDRIDVVRGGAAVQYGPNNVGGMINLVSKPIPQQWTTTLSSRITAGGAGRFLRDTAVTTGGYLTETFGLQLDADWLKGQYGREHSDTDVKNARLRAEWAPSARTLVKAEISRYVANMDLAGALSAQDYAAGSRRSTRTLDEFSGRTTRASVTLLQDLGSWGPFDATQLDWTTFNADSTRNFVVGMRRAAAETWAPDLPPQLRQSAPRGFSIFGSEPRLTLKADSAHSSHTITVGVRGMREDIDFIVGNTGLDNGVQTVVRDWRFKDRAWAGYISDAIGLFDKRLTLTPGLRFEHLDSAYYNRATGASTDNPIRNLLPGLTVGYQFDPRWYGFVDAQRSLRAPQVTQIIYGNNLDSELAWNYEAGVRFSPSQALQLSAAAYRIDFDNQIELDNTSRAYGNLGRTRRQGLELEARWQPAALRDWTLNAGYTYLDATLRSGTYRGNTVPYAARNQFNLGATWLGEGGSVAVDGYYFGSSWSDKGNTVDENAIGSIGRMPAYWVWNAKATRVLSRSAGGNVLTSSLMVNNLFNRKYFFRGIDTSPWGRQPAPAATVSLGLEYTF